VRSKPSGMTAKCLWLNLRFYDSRLFYMLVMRLIVKTQSGVVLVRVDCSLEALLVSLPKRLVHFEPLLDTFCRE